ncbi:MAG: hypothetical protein EOM51_03965 [Clostridia bacterium]|nr:hypothetical protein [Clostridia bacterium]
MASNKTALGVAYLYTAIMVVFSFLNLLGLIIPNVSGSHEFVFVVQILSPFTYVCLIIFFHRLNKKQGQNLPIILKDHNIRKSMGLIILLSGLLSLADSLPSIILSLAIPPVEKISTTSSTISVEQSINWPGISFYFFIVACPILAGILLYTHKDKNLAAYESETYSFSIIQGTTLLYIIFSSLFALVSKATSFLFTHSNSFGLLSALNYSKFWLLLMAAVVCALCLTCRKHKLKLLDLFRNSSVRLSVGFLILIGGIGDFVSFISTQIVALHNLKQLPEIAMNDYESNLPKRLVSLAILVIQLLLGVYFLRKRAYKSEQDTHQIDNE